MKKIFYSLIIVLTLTCAQATFAQLPPPSINNLSTPGSTTGANTGSSASFSSSKIKTACNEFNMAKPDFSSIPNILGFSRCFIGSLFPLVMLLGVVFFLWNIAQYVIRPNPLKDAERRKYILAGFIGLFVMVTLWGLTYFVSSTLGVGHVVPQISVVK